MPRKAVVSEQRKYGILNVDQARRIASDWLQSLELLNITQFGLPEVDDRYHVWRIPVLDVNGDRAGECVIDARSSLISEARSSNPHTLRRRLLGEAGSETNGARQHTVLSSVRNTVAQGDSEELLLQLPAESVQLIFTSPPYFNARPEYMDYIDYEGYLLKMRKIIRNACRVLEEGRFFVLNVAPVLIRRADRTQSSKRIAVPFDFHRLFVEEGFDFIDDIIWLKPEGAGWATGRGRRFAADRNPLQYKAVPVTEYVLVYRKKSQKLIDWHIRNHPDQNAVRESKIGDDYERTNVWKIHPAHTKDHPAVFPLELAEKVIRYYSFKGDAILDPFAGTGTVGRAAAKLNRRFVLLEQDPKYIDIIRDSVPEWVGKAAKDVLFLNCESADVSAYLF